MSIRFVEIVADQRPFPYGVDEHSRTLFSSNYRATAVAPTWIVSGAVQTSFEESIVSILAGQGLATSGVDTFIGPRAEIPATAGPFVSIIDTGGIDTLETHDGARYDRLSFQIIVRGTNYATARGRALSIWSALDGTRNVTVA